MIALVPLAILVLLLFTPPLAFGIASETLNFVYFLIIIMCFELFFTIYDVNFTALFPELFLSVEERTKANNVRQAFAIVGLIMAFVLPGLFISDYSNPANLPQYQIFGIIIAIIIIVPGALFLKFSPNEKSEFGEDYKETPGFIESLKHALKVNLSHGISRQKSRIGLFMECCQLLCPSTASLF